MGQVQLIDAAKHPLPDDSAGIWFSNPPYHDAAPYVGLRLANALSALHPRGSEEKRVLDAMLLAVAK